MNNLFSVFSFFVHIYSLDKVLIVIFSCCTLTDFSTFFLFTLFYEICLTFSFITDCRREKAPLREIKIGIAPGKATIIFFLVFCHSHVLFLIFYLFFYILLNSRDRSPNTIISCTFCLVRKDHANFMVLCTSWQATIFFFIFKFALLCFCY